MMRYTIWLPFHDCYSLSYHMHPDPTKRSQGTNLRPMVFCTPFVVGSTIFGYHIKFTWNQVRDWRTLGNNIAVFKYLIDGNLVFLATERVNTRRHQLARLQSESFNVGEISHSIICICISESALKKHTHRETRNESRLKKDKNESFPIDFTQQHCTLVYFITHEEISTTIITVRANRGAMTTYCGSGLFRDVTKWLSKSEID